MIRRTQTGGLIADGDIELARTDRVPGEYQVTVKGVIRFVGPGEAASIVFNDLTDRNASNRQHQDNMLRRLLR